MKTYKITISGKEIEVTQNEDGSFNKPDIVKELEPIGTALKPAFEPICMAMKPLSEKNYVANVLKYGTGGINIDESRVETSDKYSYPNGAGGNSFSVGEEPDGRRIEPVESNSLGRFPANLIHDNSEEVRECFPETAKSTGGRSFQTTSDKYGEYANNFTKEDPGFGDSGNASRFFKSIIYQAKASKSDRGDGNAHPTVKPTELLKYLINMCSREGQVILDPFMGSWTTARACKDLGRDFIGFDLSEEYCKIGHVRLAYMPTHQEGKCREEPRQECLF